MKFEGFENVVHVDEKWFYMTKEGRNTYVTPNEETVYRHCKSKRFIAKVMFLSAVAQPRYDSTGACVFDGKLGLWPFTEQIPAQRRSKNRPRGTPVTMPININRDKYRAMLIDKVIPSIIAKWPHSDIKQTIRIQQDNAGPHIKPGDVLFDESAHYPLFDFNILCQPANSPDMNILDLGFFNSIQSLQNDYEMSTIDDIVDATLEAFEHETPHTLAKVFVSLQQVMILTMQHNGSNEFKLEHMHKDSLTRRNQLPSLLKIPDHLVDQVQLFLRSQ
jgi:hypothetical protein